MKILIQYTFPFCLMLLSVSCNWSSKITFMETKSWQKTVIKQMQLNLLICNTLYNKYDTVALQKHRYIQLVTTIPIEQQLISIKSLNLKLCKKDTLLLTTTKIGYGYDYDAKASTFLYIKYSNMIKLYTYDVVKQMFVKNINESSDELEQYYQAQLNCLKQKSNCGDQANIYTFLDTNLNITQVKVLINNCP